MSDYQDRCLDVLFVSYERFRCSPQIGTACVMSWHELWGFFSRPSIGDAKDIAGAYLLSRCRDNVRRKSHQDGDCIHGVVVDIDEGGDVDAAADAVGRYAAICHETFSSTADAPRCRIVLLLAEPIDVPSYEETHRVIRAHLGAVGLVADEGAKDASRLSYSPVRRPGAGYRCRKVDGVPLDARALLAAQPPKPRPVSPPVAAPNHADAYIRGALRRASDAVAHAGEGARNRTLNAEAFALARLEIDDVTIERTLTDAARAAGLPADETRKTITSALRARRGAA